MVHIEIGTWKNGDPVVIDRFEVESRTEGIRDLIRIGNNPLLNLDYMAELFESNASEHPIAQLNIFRGLGDTFPYDWVIEFQRVIVDENNGYVIEEQRIITSQEPIQSQYRYYIAQMNDDVRQYLPIGHRDYKTADPFLSRIDAVEAADLAVMRFENSRIFIKEGY